MASKIVRCHELQLRDSWHHTPEIVGRMEPGSTEGRKLINVQMINGDRDAMIDSLCRELLIR